MKRLATIATAALCCAALAAGPGGDGRPEGGRRGGMGPHGGLGPMMTDPIVRIVNNPRVAEKLGLSAEQKEKLKELRKGPEANRETQKKMREATMRQVELLKADKIDEGAVMKAIDEVFELRKEMAKEQARRVIAVKSILTPDQIATAHEEMKNFKMEHGDRGPRQPRPRRNGGDKTGAKPEPKAE